MTRTDRFWTFFLITSIGLSLVTLGMVAYIVFDLPPARQNQLIQIFQLEMYPVILLVFILFATLWAVGDIVYNRYIRPVKRMAAEAEIIYSANPSHRLDIQGGRDVAGLARVINDFADMFEHLDQDIKTQILSARRETETERNLLAAVMDQLPQGVIICNTLGEISFYNHLARSIFDSKENPQQVLGLGRSIFHLIPHGEIDPVMGRPQGHDEDLSFTLTGEDQRQYQVLPSMLMNGKALEPHGFMLVFQPVSPKAATPLAGHQQILVPGNRPEFFDFDLFDSHSHHGDQPLKSLTYTVMDTETTGLDPETDEIISIAALRIVNLRMISHDSFDELVDPRRHIPMDSYRIHGIHPDMVAGKESIEKVLPRFHAFASDTVLVGHNIAFDLKMFKEKEGACGVSFSHPVLDTLLLSALLHPAHQDHGLEAIGRRLGVEILGRHTALGDAVATAKIFLKLVPLLKEHGILTLAQAQNASRKTYYSRLKY